MVGAVKEGRGSTAGTPGVWICEDSACVPGAAGRRSRGVCTAPMAALQDTDSSAVLFTLHRPDASAVTSLLTAAPPLAACKPGAVLPACVPWAKLFSSSFFSSSSHRPSVQLAALARSSTLTAQMWCLQIKYAMNTMKMLYMPNLTFLLKYTVADLCLHNLLKHGR